MGRVGIELYQNMETVDLKQPIAQGENTTTEFKENFDQEVIETAAAFANTESGTILIGCPSFHI